MRILLVHNQYKEPGGEDMVFYAERALLSSHGHQVDELLFDNKGIKSPFDKLAAAFSLIYNRASARALRSKIAAFCPDVIHVHNFVPLASPSILFVAAEFFVPVVVTLHNYRLLCPSVNLFYKGKIYEESVDTLFPLKAILKAVYRDSMLETAMLVFMTYVHALLGTWKNRVDVYIALTQFASQKFAKSAIALPPRKIAVKPNFVADYGKGNSIREDFFLFVGRLIDYKGIHTLLRAHRLSGFKLVIIGDGPLADLVKDYAGANANVRFLGYQHNDTVLDYIRRCRALIFPSLVYEGFPITVAEALCAGTVVIGSKLGGMAEIIRDGVNGLHFEPDDDEDLRSKIRKVDTSPEYVERLSDQARLTYMDRYSPEANYRQLMEIYHQACVSKRQQLKDINNGSV